MKLTINDKIMFTIQEDDIFFLGTLLTEEKIRLNKYIDDEEIFLKNASRQIFTDDELKVSKEYIERYKNDIERINKIGKDLGIRI